MTSNKPVGKPTLDFNKVEMLRKHMLLGTQDMAKLLGVSRMTYWAWVRGRPPRDKKALEAVKVVQKLLKVMVDYSWPDGEVIAMGQKKRFDKLKALLKN